jgi:hypothetical protein
LRSPPQGGRVGGPSHRRFGACLSRTGLCAQSTAFALVRTYAHSDLTSFTTHGWKAYGLADIQAHPDRFFSQFSSRLKLRVETVKPDQREQGDQPDGAPKPQERVEQWDVLAGLRNYATEHVVLIGKPGSGKSTSLERLLWEEAEKALNNPIARIPVLVKLRECSWFCGIAVSAVPLGTGQRPIPQDF